MARSTGPVHIADNSVTAINDALQQLMFMIDELKGEHSSTTIKIGPHTHASNDPDDQDGGAIPSENIVLNHDDLLNVTTDQHHAKLHETSHREGGIDELKLDDTGAPEDNTDNDASISAHGLLRKLDNNALHFLDGQGNWSAVVATSTEANDVANIEADATAPIWEQIIARPGITINEIANGNAITIGGANIWSPDAPPTGAGADDDEFADASGGVPTGWTEVDFDSNITVSEDSSGLTLVQATHAGHSVGGVYKTIPAGDFTIWTKLTMSGVLPGANSISCGLALFQDATSSTGDLVFLRNYVSGTTEVQTPDCFNMSAYTTFGTQVGVTYSMNVTNPTYFRIRRTGTNYSFDVSGDGVGWLCLFNASSIAITPTHYGIVINNSASGANQKVTAAFFRYLNSDVGLNGVVSGNRI